jgi:threonyl-tRNA synthetase
MPTITLPDGKTKSFDKPVTGLEIAASIGAGLAKAALAVKVDTGAGYEIRDLSHVIDRDAKVALITAAKPGQPTSPEALALMRHSAAHVMAEAIQDVIGKDVLLAYGPATDTGFFYDMSVPEGKKISSDHFDAINKRMAEIIKEDRPFNRVEMPAYADSQGTGAISYLAFFAKNKYKVHNANRAIDAQISEELGTKPIVPELMTKLDSDPNQVAKELFDRLAGQYKVSKAKLSFYFTGRPHESWDDLCRGPHVPSTGRIGAVRVLSLASSFWQSDEKLDRLIRVYGTAFPSQAELDEYLKQKEEAAKRDHRVIGKNLRLFHIDETVGQGLILWTPNGAVVRKELQSFIGAELKKQGYTEVFTPHIGSLDLYKTSGHFPYYKDAQFPPIIERDTLDALATCPCAEVMRRVEGVSQRLADGINERTKATTISKDRILPDDQLVQGFMLRPMNCPHHAKIFASSPHSYRDMPVRLAEFGTVYRWEQSGELNGLTRVRGFTQDDAHLFCTEEQIPGEIQGCLSLVKTIFHVLGMKDYRVRVGLRDPDSTKFTGSPESWDKAEAACLAAAQSLGVPFSKEPGEAAFYGPKIDFVVKDVIGREWQLGTVQVDYQMGNRFDLHYVGPDNKPHRPVVIHRAPFGSMERFCGVLIEHFAGAFPTWLSPEQVRVLPISDKTLEYAQRVERDLRDRGVRVSVDAGNDRIQAKVKVAADEKVPYMLIVGPRDAEQSAVSVRVRGIEKDLGAMPLVKFVERIASEIGERRAELGATP